MNAGVQVVTDYAMVNVQFGVRPVMLEEDKTIYIINIGLVFWTLVIAIGAKVMKD